MNETVRPAIYDSFYEKFNMKSLDYEIRKSFCAV